MLRALSYEITLENYSSLVEKIFAISTDSAFKAYLTKRVAPYEKLKAGSPSPVFENFKNYAGGTTSLADLKGKYVFIDIWATWCGPCIQELPILEKIEAQFVGKDIEFVCISMDKEAEYEKWKAMVKKKNLKGMQLFANGDPKGSFFNEYFIYAIPRYILLDKEGNIINPNAPRPSDPALLELLNSLKW